MTDLLLLGLVVIILALALGSQRWFIVTLRKKIGTFHWTLILVLELFAFCLVVYLLTSL